MSKFTKKQRQEIYRLALEELDSSTSSYYTDGFNTRGLCPMLRKALYRQTNDLEWQSELPSKSYIEENFPELADVFKLKFRYSAGILARNVFLFPINKEWGHTIRAMVLLEAIQKTKL